MLSVIINNESGRTIYKNTVDLSRTLPRTGEYVQYKSFNKKVNSVVWDTDLTTVVITIEN